MSAANWRTLLVGALLLTSCNAPHRETGGTGITGPGESEGPLGSVSLSLTVGAAYAFDEVTYDVSGGGKNFHRTGTINVAGNPTVSTIIAAIPLGTGYVVTLTSQDVGHKLTPCTGSGSFDLTSSTIVPVSVHLTCHEIVAPAVAAPVPVPRWAFVLLAALLLSVVARYGGRARPR